MKKKLYVGNLSFSTTEEALGALFTQVGTVVSCKVITDRDTGRSKGFGFIEMSSAEGADAAIEKFSGFKHDGRAMTVNEAKPQAPRY